MTSTVVTANPDTPFPELVDLLLRHGISGLPIVDDDHNLIGMVTEADLISKEAYGGRRRRALELLADLVAGGETRWALKGKGRTAAQVMTTKLVTARPGEDLRAAARRLLENRLKRLPVVEDEKLVGIVSRTDVLRVLHRTDDDLARDVAALLADPLRAPEDHSVEATVTDGIVTLQGTVRFPMDLPVLAAMVWQLPGVVDVRNEAKGREPDPRIMPW
ncbi:MAG: CBS domain-containing protein [Acidimicrobiales bacterium]